MTECNTANETSLITIRGARQNNLKNVNVDIRPGTLTVITGPSGSGKSSLAFDTLYAEGQRRYAETFSPYARQFLERSDRPKVDKIDGVPPAIAINQSGTVRTSRSTVGTMTELDFRDSLCKVSCPALIVCGEKDNANKKASKELASYLSDSHFHELLKAGHEANIESPEELATVLQEFYDNVE